MKRKMFFMLGVFLGMISVTAYASQGRVEIVQSEQLRVEKSVNPGSVVTAEQNASDPSDRKDEETSRILIAYFTRADNIGDPSGLDAVSSASLNLNNGEIEGNMEYLAKNIQSLTDGDLFSIQTEASYSQNYRETTAQARQEQRSGERPVLKTHVENMADYDVIYIGYPNWWGTIPMPIYTFLEEYDLKGKNIIPFCSHEGSGLGSSVSDIKAVCPDSDILNGFAVRGSRATLSETSAEMEEWLREIGQL